MLKIVPFFLLLALVLTGCSAQSVQGKTYRHISMKEAIRMMKEETDYIILDVRTADEYAAGHIPGAVLLPNETISSAEIPQLPDKDQLIMVYCRSGNRSRQAAQKLVMLGYTHVVEFGGISSWPGEIVRE